MNNYNAEFPYSQRGVKKIEDAERILKQYGYVSITDSSIPKKDIKTFKELVKNCEVIEIKEFKKGFTTVPTHKLYKQI